jgi:PAS domain S-box-containing protein
MKQKTSLKRIILFILISFIIFVPSVIGIISSYNFYNSEIETSIHNQSQTLKQVTVETNELLEMINRVSKYIKSNYNDNSDLLKNIVDVNENITSIIILNKKGIISDLYSNKNTNIYKGFDYSNKSYFKKIDDDKDYYWSDLFFSPLNEAQTFSYSFKMNDYVGVIFINLTDIESLVKIFKNTDKSYMVRMYDRNGIVILNPDKPDLQNQSIDVSSKSLYVDFINKVKPFVQTKFNKNNSSKSDIGMYTTIEETGWKIVVRECYEKIIENLTNMLIEMAILVLLFIVISIFIIVKISKIMFSSLDELENISSSIAYGEYSSKIKESSFKEFNALINSFKNMQHEIKKREVSLQKSVDSFESLINSTMEGILLHEDEICFDVNDIAVKLLGYSSKDEIVGKNVLDFVSASSYNDVKSNMLINSEPYEIKMIRKDGIEFEALVQAKFIEMNNKKAKVSAIIDITEIKQKDKLLFQQAKMASMGEMIGNIAHQWRQPLSTISAAASGMKFQKEFGVLKDDDFSTSTDVIVKSTKFLSTTIDDFRNFFNIDKECTEFSINKAVKKSLSLMNASLISNFIEVHNFSDEDIIYYGHKNELIQALMNILTNAKDAFLLNKTDYNNRIIIINIKKINEKIIINIHDNAGGIPEDILNKIFEPYFTTKHKSQGTGIGLYMTHQIICEHMNGKIDVQNSSFKYENEKYFGVNFTIEL